MSSRDYILKRAKANKPEAIALPKIDVSVFDDSRNILSEFTLKVETAGGNVFEATSDDDVISKVKSMFPDGKVNFSTLKHTKNFNTLNIEKINKPHDLEDLDVLVLESSFGVAENGAIWVADSQLPMRVLPFIAKHLVLVLNKDSIVTFMHQAYKKLSSNDTDFGVFISGPSKTADIEQSLVIGAHGALSLSVFLKEN
ncbi:L-lactate dehydrogenase complex protein LldG [Jejuia pallidilutea]|uniref:L-lactate dehydrogenase complex protein LldG n=1 Tax=Jejuia pallidilutea TaxID=504487 RepID=A0A362X2Y7_9FLAO|nr:LUD domain-containing protein [Jejuia pallidilutea]PQV50622.1 L-lactate dehydrogenase complex protein LldG [Jejuia pallidilutea]